MKEEEYIKKKATDIKMGIREEEVEQNRKRI